jgi:hypothetical protein
MLMTVVFDLREHWLVLACQVIASFESLLIFVHVARRKGGSSEAEKLLPFPLIHRGCSSVPEDARTSDCGLIKQVSTTGKEIPLEPMTLTGLSTASGQPED